MRIVGVVAAAFGAIALSARCAGPERCDPMFDMSSPTCVSFVNQDCSFDDGGPAPAPSVSFSQCGLPGAQGPTTVSFVAAMDEHDSFTCHVQVACAVGSVENYRMAWECRGGSVTFPSIFGSPTPICATVPEAGLDASSDAGAGPSADGPLDAVDAGDD